MLSSWIKRLNEENGRLYKESVLKEALTLAELGDSTADRFLSGFRWCYDSMITYGVKHIEDTTGIIGAENSWDEFQDLLLDLKSRRVTGHAARDAIQAVSENFDSEEWNLFLAPILRRDLRVGISEKTFNKVVGKDSKYYIPVFACQLATDSENRPEMSGKVRLEPKLDGVRVICYIGITPNSPDGPVSYTTMYSRNGKPFENFGHIQAQLCDIAGSLYNELFSSMKAYGFILDGEVVSNTFQNLMRQTRRKENVQAEDSVFHVFDIMSLPNFAEGHCNTPLTKRVEILNKLGPVFDKTDSIRLIPHLDVDLDTDIGKQSYLDYMKQAIVDGFEGVMIKNLSAPYLCTRNKYWLKYKPTITVDLQVVGVEEGTGRNKGRLGALVCSGHDHGKDITVNVGSGFSDLEREQFWNDRASIFGQTVEILADTITQNQDGTYSLRFPRFVRFRDDK